MSASVPPVEAPIATTFSVVSAMAWVAGERMASAVSLGSTVAVWPERAQLRRGRGLDSLAESYPRILQKLFAAEVRFGDDFDRPHTRAP